VQEFEVSEFLRAKASKCANKRWGGGSFVNQLL
jgi:hypothetical protein